MSTSAKALAEKVVQLPVEDRAYLIERLLASLEETDLQEQWVQEALQRQDEVRSGRVKPIEADEVYRRIDEILQGSSHHCHRTPSPRAGVLETTT
jgi:putative addiction module component (TIGR02574 family)